MTKCSLGCPSSRENQKYQRTSPTTIMRKWSKRENVCISWAAMGQERKWCKKKKKREQTAWKTLMLQQCKDQKKLKNTIPRNKPPTLTH